MQKIRVLVANRPRLMKDLVLATIGDQPDIEVVGETQDEAEITELVERTRPDYLIIALENPEVRPGLSGFLLGRYPEMKILALAAERNSGIFYWAFVDIRSMPVESSEQGILGVLRSKPELVGIYTRGCELRIRRNQNQRQSGNACGCASSPSREVVSRSRSSLRDFVRGEGFGYDVGCCVGRQLAEQQTNGIITG